MEPNELLTAAANLEHRRVEAEIARVEAERRKIENDDARAEPLLRRQDETIPDAKA